MRLLLGAEAAKLHVVGPAVRAELVRRDFGAGLEQQHLRARLAQLLGYNSAGGAGADDADVIVGCRH